MHDEIVAAARERMAQAARASGDAVRSAVRDAEQARTRASHRSFEITREGLAAARDAEAEPAPVKSKPAPPSDEEEFGGSFLVESFDTRAMRPPRPPGARAESSVEVDQGLPRSMRDRARNTFNHQDEW